jgi:transcriptional regulator with XRE-family HTH domain
VTEKTLTAWVPFGREVRILRTGAGLSLAQVADSLTITAGMLSKVERATRATKKDTAAELDRFFGTEGRLLRRWSDANTDSVSPDWFREIQQSEKVATEIRTWAPILPPGWLQTPEYARAIFRAGRPLDPPASIERLVEGRKERFAFLTGERGPALWVVLDASVLTRVVGEVETRRGQLDRYIELAESGTVRIQLVPADTPDSPGNSGPFRLLTSGSGTTILYSEGSSSGHVIDSLTEVRRHVAIFEDLRGVALPPLASLAMIRRTRDELA